MSCSFPIDLTEAQPIKRNSLVSKEVFEAGRIVVL
jgi:hypothetical protein